MQQPAFEGHGVRLALGEGVARIAGSDRVEAR
jgi:hypothetical protein